MWVTFSTLHKTIPEDLNLKFKSKANHGLTNHGWLHCAFPRDLFGFQETRVHEETDSQFLFQNIQGEVCEFKNNLRFTRAAWWINSKTSNRDNSTTFMVF